MAKAGVCKTSITGSIPVVASNSCTVFRVFGRPGAALAVALILAAETALLAFLYLHLCHALGPPGFPLDDSWIHAHFARNIAEGRGMVYNPGQPTTSTAPLHSLILALLFVIARTPVFNALALGLLLHLASSVVLYMTARRLSIAPSLSLAAAMAFAAIPRLMWGAMSGMEVPLYVFLTCLGLFWHVRYERQDLPRAYLSTVAFGLATLARPECAVLAAFCAVDGMLNRAKQDGKPSDRLRPVKAAAIHIALFLAIVGPLLAYNLWSSGKPLPPAYYAKTLDESGTASLVSILSRAASSLVAAGDVLLSDSPILTLLAIPGAIYCLTIARGKCLLLPLAVIVTPLVIALVAPTGPDMRQLSAQHGRYSAYLCPPLTLLAVLGTRYLHCLVAGRWARFGLAVGLLIAAALHLAWSNLACARVYALEVHNVNAMQVALGKWAARHPRGTIIATNDVGAIAYFSGHPVLDTVGVVDAHVVVHLRRHEDRQLGLWQYLRERKPQCVVIFPRWYPLIAGRQDVLTSVKSIRLARNVLCGDTEMVAYKADWEMSELRPELMSDPSAAAAQNKRDE